MLRIGIFIWSIIILIILCNTNSIYIWIISIGFIMAVIVGVIIGIKDSKSSKDGNGTK